MRRQKFFKKVLTNFKNYVIINTEIRQIDSKARTGALTRVEVMGSTPISAISQEVSKERYLVRNHHSSGGTKVIEKPLDKLKQIGYNITIEIRNSF